MVPYIIHNIKILKVREVDISYFEEKNKSREELKAIKHQKVEESRLKIENQRQKIDFTSLYCISAFQVMNFHNFYSNFIRNMLG